MMITHRDNAAQDPTPSDWEALGPVILALRGQGGAGAADDTGRVARCADGGATREDVHALAYDAPFRRDVAATMRVMSKPVPARGRRWPLASLAAAAVMAGLLFAVPRPAAHRGDAAAAVVLAPPAADAASWHLTWQTVLGADAYEIEVTGADGRTRFSARTTDTLAAVPAADLGEGRLFYRVRARIDADRWIASEFRELVRP